MEKELDNLVDYIKNSESYKNVILLKEKMSLNEKVINFISEIKLLQMDYVNNNFDPEIKEKIDCLNDELNLIPVYVEYNYYLDEVNEMIELVKDELNNYFDKVFNNIGGMHERN